MGTTLTSFIICALSISSRLAYHQPVFTNSSEVSVSAANDSSAWLPNATATPQKAATPQTPNLTLVCNKKLSCRNRCNNERTEWDELSGDPLHCHCDQSCLKYYDCCADFAQFCHPGSPVNQENENMDYTCTKLSNEPGQKDGVFVISTCAEGWIDEDVRTKCLTASKSESRAFTSANIEEDIPVSLILDQQTTYRNIYCGRCNKVPHDSLLLFWTLEFRCNIQPASDYNATQVLDFMLKYCPNRIVKPPQAFKVRTCVPVVSTCSVTQQTEIKNRCLNTTSGLVYSEETRENYKNYYCMLCNGLSTNDAKCGPRGKEDIFNPKSFEIVMEFSSAPGNQGPELISVTSVCATGHVYDPHLETCRLGYIPSPSSAIRDKYRVKLWMSPVDDQITSVSSDEFRDALCTLFSLDPSQTDTISIGKEDSSVAVAFNLYAGTSRTDDKLMAPEETLDATSLLSFNHSFNITIAGKRWIVLRVTQRQLSCVQSEEFFPGEFDLGPTGLAYIKKTEERLPPKRYFLVKNISTGENSLLVCSSKFTVMCPFVLLPISSSEYEIFSNKSLRHTTTGRLYTTGEYDLDNETALICTNYTEVNYTNSSVPVPDPNITEMRESESVFLRYLTIIGFSVSISTLILTLAVHFTFSELRSPLPGKNLMSLCVALFLAQFMWLIGTGDTDKPVFCTVVAAVLHYLFLVSFACTSVIAFDTSRTFSSQISKAPGGFVGRGNLRFLTYTCVAWGSPMLFVSICFLLDHFEVVEIGYGNEEACWLVNGNAKILTFATPVACVLLYNVAAFSQTIRAISTARKQTSRVKSTRSDRGFVFKVYIRLVTLMGFTWFFSFTAELIHRTLIYPFVVLTTLQGVYIFVAFVCKKRIFKLMKDLLPRSRKDALASTQHTASTVCKGLQPYQSKSETEDTHM